MTADHDSWCSSDGVQGSYQRQIRGSGRFFTTRSPRTGRYSQVIAGATVSGSFDVDSVRNAWLAARFEMPALALTLQESPDGSCMAQYAVPRSDSEAQRWSFRSLFTYDHSEECLVDTLSIGDPADAADIGTCHVLPRPDGSMDIYVRVPHALFDGYGTFIALDCVLRHLGQVVNGAKNWGEEVARLPLDCSTLLHATGAPLSDEATRDFNEALATCEMLKVTPLLGPKHVPDPNAPITPGACSTRIVTLSEDESTRLFRGLAQLGFTVGLGIAHCAAIARYRQLMPDLASNPSVLFLPVSIDIAMRKLLREVAAETSTSIAMTTRRILPRVNELATASSTFVNGRCDAYNISLPSIDGFSKRIASIKDLANYEDALVDPQMEMASVVMPEYGTAWIDCSFLGPLDELGYLKPSYGFGPTRITVSKPMMNSVYEHNVMVLNIWTFQKQLYLKTRVNLNYFPASVGEVCTSSPHALVPVQATVQDFERIWLGLLRQIAASK